MATLMDGDIPQTRVSLNGTAEITTVGGAKNCSYPTVSNDGDLLVFTTRADTTPGGTNAQNRFQIWLRDLTTTDTFLVSGNAVGPNGRINPPGKGSPRAMISGAGQHVVFESAANSFPDDLTDTIDDVWIYDVDTFALERISEVQSTGVGGNGRSSGPPAVSEFGRYVAFTTAATNLVDVDPFFDTTVCSGLRPRGGIENIVVLDRGDSNLPVGGTPANTPHIEWVSFGLETFGTPPAQLVTCTQPDGPSTCPSLSAGGCKVAYLSEATNLTNPPVPQADPNDPIHQVYVYDRMTGVNQLVSQSTAGAVANGDCSNAKISADGRFVVFLSEADNLVLNDNNGFADVFVRDLVNDETERMSIAQDGSEWTEGPGISIGLRFPKISPNGRFVTFGGKVDPAESFVTTDTILDNANVVIHDRDADDNGIFDELTPGTFDVKILSWVPDSLLTEPDDNTGAPLAFTKDSKYVFFETNSSNLSTQGDTNGDADGMPGGIDGRDIYKRQVWQ